jgi:hypothetical protein
MSPYYDPTTDLDVHVQSEENKLVNLGLTKMPFPHITGLKLQEDVQLGELLLNYLDSSTGVVWVLSDLQGWWTLPDPEFPDIARGWGDGSYDANGRYTARVLTLEGSFLTQSPSQVAEARAKLTAAINLVYRGTDLIVREKITLTAPQINAVVAIAADKTANTVTVPSHGLSANAAITYKSDGAAISGLTSGTTYYVKTVVDSNTITLSTTSGGSVVDITANGLPSLTTHTFGVSNNSIILPSHGLITGDAVTYKSEGTAISGLVSGRTYYVKTASTNDRITLSATSGGSTISISGTELAANTKHTFEAVKPKATRVRISGKPQIETVNARGRTNFSIGLKAADPIKYEYLDAPDDDNFRVVTLTRNTDVTVRNAGNTPVTVIFSITGGDIAGGEILNTANGTTQTISGVYMESADSRLEIDTYNRNIIAVNSSSVARVGRKYADSYVDWIYLEPGDNVLRFSSTDSTAVCVMYYKSGWIG